MINKNTIDKIFDTVRIEEVVGDFVNLKKRGVNLIGLCPFHNERTPSFNVNPVRNIFKCFGCGKGGSAVNFIMEHEHYSYPEALRYLAKKYNIEVEEEAQTQEQLAMRDEKESMLVLNSFAQKYFSENLFNDEEGKAIGHTYFKERGFTDATIEKFQLGYSLNDWSAFSDHALKNSFTSEFLVKTGLSIAKETSKEISSEEKKDERLIDRFKGRVMFPVHNLGGRVIAFGGRILKKDDKTAKYLNSPESEVYSKSKVLYGIYFAKNAITKNDNCYLVEGYTDVISLHQSGIENVVASSGTSLTTEQIKLISRYTKNVTVLYDADPAGIKASLRGIDMILEAGLNVKVVLFPQGEDPDSFARTHSHSEIHDYLYANAKDFVVFKTSLLLEEVSNDPVRKSQLIRDVVETIAKIPDAITRSVYTKHCSALMDISEQVLINELNKVRRQQMNKVMPTDDVEELMPEVMKMNQPVDMFSAEYQEKEIIRLLLNFGNHQYKFSEEIEILERKGKKEYVERTEIVSHVIVDELEKDSLEITHKTFSFFFKEISGMVKEGKEITPEHFYQSENPEVSSLAVELLSSKYFLSENWELQHQIRVPQEEMNLKNSVESAVYHLKNKMVMKMIDDNQQKIKEAHLSGSEYNHLIEQQQALDRVKVQIAKMLGIDVLK